MLARTTIVALFCAILLSTASAQSKLAAWKTARHARGHFAVKLSCPPVAFTFGPKRHANGPVQNSFHLGCRRKDNKKFTAVRIQYKDAGPGSSKAESIFDTIVHNKKWRTLRAKIVKTRFQGYSAVDINVQQRTQCGALRHILAPPDLFILAIEALDNQCEGLSVLTDEFFSSLIIEPR